MESKRTLPNTGNSICIFSRTPDISSFPNSSLLAAEQLGSCQSADSPLNLCSQSGGITSALFCAQFLDSQASSSSALPHPCLLNSCAFQDTANLLASQWWTICELLDICSVKWLCSSNFTLCDWESRISEVPSFHPNGAFCFLFS